MSLTPILFLGAYFLGLLASVFVGARFGAYTYFLAFHMSPHGSWWGASVPDLRYLWIAGLVAFATALLMKDPHQGESWIGHAVFKLFLVFNVWLWLINFWSISPLHLEGCELFGKHLIIMLVVYWVAKGNIEMLKQVCLAIVLGCGWIGWQAMGRSGRVEGVAGAISDANTLGMHAATGVMVAAMMILGFRGVYRWIPFACMPFILNTVILAGSRGAFLGLLAGGFTAMYFCPKHLKGQFKMMGALGAVLFLMLAHDQFIDRMMSLVDAMRGGEQTLDTSATSRIDIAKAGWRMALDHPMGAGHRGTAVLSPYYMDARLLTSGSKVGQERGRAAHNSFMAALVSYGFPGFVIFVLMFVWSGRVSLRLRKFANMKADNDVGILASIIGSGLTVVVVAGQFSNYVYAEIQFWLMGMLAALLTMTLRNAGPDSLLQPKKRKAIVHGASSAY